MKIKLSSLRKFLQWQGQSFLDSESDNSRHNPADSARLPPEIMHMIFGYAVGVPVSESGDVEITFPDISGLWNWHLAEDRDLVRDRISLSMVCSVWREMVDQVRYRRIVIRSSDQLEAVVGRLEECKKRQEPYHTGNQTLRLDIAMKETAPYDQVRRLLKCTPNLTVYCQRICGPFDISVLQLQGATGLRRIELATAEESVPYIIGTRLHLYSALQGLTVIRISSPPSLLPNYPSNIRLPSVKVVSLGDPHRPEMPHKWDNFITSFLCTKDHFPSLKRLDSLSGSSTKSCITLSVFQVYGQQLEFISLSGSRGWDVIDIRKESNPT
ncbi:hypothetical protein CPC08DRAFT_761527 [Agrocybe pediades]|nr:hypothetical protein CPC08DRAFT_761527 [Agrocybe pediades]